MLQGRTVLLYARAARRSPELHKLFYAILCVKFDITSVRTEMRNHPRQSEMAGYIGGKRRRMGAWGSLAEQYFFYFGEETKILIRKSKKFIRKKTCDI